VVSTVVKDHDAFTIRITQSKKNSSGTVHRTTQHQIPEDFLLVKQFDILKSVYVADTDVVYVADTNVVYVADTDVVYVADTDVVYVADTDVVYVADTDVVKSRDCNDCSILVSKQVVFRPALAETLHVF